MLATQALETILRDYPGGRRKFAQDAKISEGRLSQLIGGEQPSPELAITIHRLSKGAVPGSLTRPDLWRRAQDVPVPDLAQKRRAG
jgi:DNA-binding transcriptional regulator YdaS (Cro superfamily)